MTYIGIDPGANGAICAIDDKGAILASEVFDPDVLVSTVRFLCENGQASCVLEKVGAMPGQGVVSMFRFGENYGYIQGVLRCFCVPYELVTPGKWKKEFSVTGDKNTSIMVCKRLFPGAVLKRTEKCKKDHDGLAEALLMAEYARRHFKFNLGAGAYDD